MVKCVLSRVCGVRKAHVKTHFLISFRTILHKQLIDHRSQLPVLINYLGLAGMGVEIGVWRGVFSYWLLKNSNLAVLYSVDPWMKYSMSIYDEQINNQSQDAYDESYRASCELLKEFGKRSVIIRKTSREAADQLLETTLDFIYIDANHSYSQCKQDLNIWWSKVRDGGIFAGHDYMDAVLPQGNYAVKKAVDEFVLEKRQVLSVTKEDYPSWYIIKRSWAEDAGMRTL